LLCAGLVWFGLVWFGLAASSSGVEVVPCMDGLLEGITMLGGATSGG
jgi:hypothetical protein